MVGQDTTNQTLTLIRRFKEQYGDKAEACAVERLFQGISRGNSTETSLTGMFNASLHIRLLRYFMHKALGDPDVQVDVARADFISGLEEQYERNAKEFLKPTAKFIAMIEEEVDQAVDDLKTWSAKRNLFRAWARADHTSANNDRRRDMFVPRQAQQRRRESLFPDAKVPENNI